MGEVRNKDKFPVQLAPKFRSQRKDIFELWRQHEGDWNTVVLHVERKSSKVTEANGTKSLVRMRDLIRNGMPEARAKDLLQRRKAAGQAYKDEDYPDVEEEMTFWYTTDTSYSEKNRVSEEMKVSGEAELSSADAEMIIGDDGILAAGARAAAPLLADKHQMSFAESMSNMLGNDASGRTRYTVPKPGEATGTGTGTNTGTGTGDAGTNTKHTLPKVVAAKLQELQKEIKEATDLQLVLEAHNVCSELEGGMKDHVAKLKKSFKNITTLQQANAKAAEYHLGQR